MVLYKYLYPIFISVVRSPGTSWYEYCTSMICTRIRRAFLPFPHSVTRILFGVWRVAGTSTVVLKVQVSRA